MLSNVSLSIRRICAILRISDISLSEIIEFTEAANHKQCNKSIAMGLVEIGINDLYRSVSEIEQLEANGTYSAKSKSKFAMRENSVPVNCFCLKADFAEASSSHNTGFAKLVHDLSMDLGSLTPPQKHKSENYK